MKVIRTEGSTDRDWIPRLCTHRGEPYAILSHRWFEDANHEVLFADIEEIDLTIVRTSEGVRSRMIKNAQYVDDAWRSKPGFDKLKGAAQQALKDGFDYIWIDTCCIDKNSSAELSEAINSMFKWYEHSGVCYVYLADVMDATDTSTNSDFGKSQWWKRGWTLQELLAPSKVMFFTRGWNSIGNRDSLLKEIKSISGTYNGPFTWWTLRDYSVAQRMSWASHRTTTRPEDMAYCLMGIFDVNMPILYGEGGEKAFLRLQREIMKDSNDESIFAWRAESDYPLERSGMLALSPAAFAGSHNVRCHWTNIAAERKTPYRMTNMGLSIHLPLRRIEGGFLVLLNCYETNVHRSISICLDDRWGRQYVRSKYRSWWEAKPHKKDKFTHIFVYQVKMGP